MTGCRSDKPLTCSATLPPYPQNRAEDVVRGHSHCPSWAHSRDQKGLAFLVLASLPWGLVLVLTPFGGLLPDRNQGSWLNVTYPQRDLDKPLYLSKSLWLF